LPGVAPARGRPRFEEHQDQCAYFAWIRADPRTRDLVIYSVPNAALAGSTQRERFRMVRALNEGLLKGVPDVNIDEARGEHHGLRLEFKRDKRNKNGTISASVLPSPEQRVIHGKLIAAGYRVHVAYGTRDAILVTCDYLGIDPPL
jgi:hypothetical protein